jgi:LmbE family N-acetylglucosaminyl deacetylase
MEQIVEKWNGPKKILIILAHPDDPEFFMGATIARWAEAGHDISYCLLTPGERGTSEPEITTEEVGKQRRVEQSRAGEVLGVNNIRIMDFSDGYLTPSIEARKQVVRVIREERPHILVSCDPTNFFPRLDYVNHPDHRAAGQIVMDAVFPAAGSRLYFSDLVDEGFEPHSPEELWLSLTAEPNLIIDVTEWWPVRLRALLEHKSQIGDKEKFIARMKSKHTPDSTLEKPRYEEQFRRIIFRR